MENQREPDVKFLINGEVYSKKTVNLTLTLNKAKEWTLENNSAIPHPFHIHTNPFQLIRETQFIECNEEEKEKKDSQCKNPLNRNDENAKKWRKITLDYKPPYVWKDVVAIPTAAVDGSRDVEPPDRSLTEEYKQWWGEAVVRYEPVNFTGGFVHHCHILGHEDLGMMHNVQVVCPEVDKTSYCKLWGKPTSNLSPECKQGNYIASPWNSEPCEKKETQASGHD